MGGKPTRELTQNELKLIAAAAMLLDHIGAQLLFAYRGERGKHNLGRFFYWFYPLHLLAIGLVSMVL